MTTSARVCWLDGTIREVELKGEQASVASLRSAVAALSSAPPSRKSCKLYLRGVELRDDDSEPLRIEPGETVACVVRAAESKRKNRRREEQAAEEVEATEARRPARPLPPGPPPQAAAAAPAPEKEPEEELEEEEEPDPLPPALRSLAQGFRTLLASYDFISRRQLRATPELLASVAAPLLASASSSSSSSSAAFAVVDGDSIRACAALCPEMISLRGGGEEEGKRRRKMIGSAALKPPPLSPTTALLSSVVAAAPPCCHSSPSPNDDGEGQRAREALDENGPFLEISKVRTRGSLASSLVVPGVAAGGGAGRAGGAGEAAAAAAPLPFSRTRVGVFHAALLRAASAAAAAGLPRGSPLGEFVRAFEEACRSRAKRREAEEEEEEEEEEQQQPEEEEEEEQEEQGEPAAAAADAKASALSSLLRADDARHRLSVSDFVSERLAGAPWYSGQMEHGRTLRPRAAKFFAVPPSGGGGESGKDDGENSSSPSAEGLLLRTLMTPPLLAAAAAAGVADGGRRLYEHQARALLLSSSSDETSRRRPFLVVAPTAAGKSLCFVLPMLRFLSQDPFATALLLYPTKALAADQLGSVRRALAAAGLDTNDSGGEGDEGERRPPVAALFDGDVPAAEREKLLPRAPSSTSYPAGKWSPLRTRVLLANPDVIHASLLPSAGGNGGGNGSSGAVRFVAGLALVAVDEAHSFSGAFACHASLVLRRLRRSCEAAKARVAMGRGGGGAGGAGGGRESEGSEGSDGGALLSPEAEADAAAARPPPLFVAASATIGNPAEHAAALLPLSAEERGGAGRSGGGCGVEVIEGDGGGGTGPRTFLLWNPPTLSSAKAASASASASAAPTAASDAPLSLPSKRARQEAVRAAVREAEQARRSGPRLQLLPSSSSSSLQPPSSSQPSLNLPGPPSGSSSQPKGAAADPFGLSTEEWLAAARLGKVRARAAADAAASLPPTAAGPSSSLLSSPPAARAPPPPAALSAPPPPPPQQQPPPPPLSPGRRTGRYLAPLPRAPSRAARDEGAPAAAAAPAPPPPRRALLSMEEVQRNQEELAATAAAAAAGSQRRRRGSSPSSRPAPTPPRSLLLVGGAAGSAAANATKPGGAFDSAAALLLRQRNSKGGGGGGDKAPFSLSNGGQQLPPGSEDSAAAAASLASAVAAREAGEAAARAGSSSGGAPPRWRERHGAAGVERSEYRASAIVECGAVLLAECVRARLRTLAFCKTRKLAELVAAHASQALREVEEREEKEGKGGGGAGSSSSKRKKTTAKNWTSTSTSSSQSSSQVLLPPLSSRVAAYRAGYDPASRRAIEQALSTGRVLGVAATNALELGVDLPNLDVTLHLGLPARAATLAQQSGRAGRRDSPSLHIAIAFDGALDQWFVRHPEKFFGRAPERAGGGFDPFRDDDGSGDENAAAAKAEAATKSSSNSIDEGILALHVACAAAECPPLDPTAAGDDSGIHFGPRLPSVTAGLVRAGVLVGGDWWSGDAAPPPLDPSSASSSARGRHQHRRSDGADRDAAAAVVAAAEAVVMRGTPLFFAGAVVVAPSSSSAPPLLPPPSRSLSLPHSTFGLRAIDEERFSIVDDASGALLEEVEASKAFFVVYDGAVVLRHARPHLCVSLCTQSRVARIRPAPDIKHYTTMRDMKDVYVVGGKAIYLPPRAPVPAALAPALSASSHPSASILPSPAVAADALVTTRFLGYCKVWRSTNRIFDSVDLRLPDVQLRTRAAFCRVPASAAARCRDELGGSGGRRSGEGSGEGGPEVREGLHAACHALVAAAPAILNCDSADFGTECDSPYASGFRPMRLLLWEKNGNSGSGSGGNGGLAERAADAFGELLAAALDIVSNCSSCAAAASSLPSQNDPGCPECTFWSGCSEYNAVLHRGAARIVLEETIKAAAAFGGGGGSCDETGEGGGLF